MPNRPEITRDIQPPQAPDAEQMVLGAVLKDPDAFNLVVEILESESHFYSPRNQMIYRACLRLYAKGEACDITTVANYLQSEGLLEKCGGRVYLVDLMPEKPIQLMGKDGQLSPPVGSEEFVQWYVQEKTDERDPDAVLRFRAQIAKHYQLVHEIGVAYGYSPLELAEQLQDMQFWIKTEPRKGDKQNYLRFIRTWLKRAKEEPSWKSGGDGPGMTYAEEQQHYERHRRTASSDGPQPIGKIIADIGLARAGGE